MSGLLRLDELSFEIIIWSEESTIFFLRIILFYFFENHVEEVWLFLNLGHFVRKHVFLRLYLFEQGIIVNEWTHVALRQIELVLRVLGKDLVIVAEHRPQDRLVDPVRVHVSQALALQFFLLL